MSSHLQPGCGKPIKLGGLVLPVVGRSVLMKYPKVPPSKIIGHDEDDVGLRAWRLGEPDRGQSFIDEQATQNRYGEGREGEVACNEGLKLGDPKGRH